MNFLSRGIICKSHKFIPMIRYTYIFLIAVFVFAACNKTNILEVESSPYDLQFSELAQTWDEGMPLGNATIGALVWEKDGALRISLDRIDLWDQRPMDSISGDNNKFQWVYDQVMKGEYLPVQKKFDHPYDNLPAPSKIPGAGLEFDLSKLGSPELVRLYLNNAVCEVNWKDGIRLQTFVHATEPVGWIRIEHAGDLFIPELVPPIYAQAGAIEDLGPVTGLDLRRLGYEQGVVSNENKRITYHQKAWGDFSYDVAMQWEKDGDAWVGVWSVTSSLSNDKAVEEIEKAFDRGLQKDYNSHLAYWKNYWNQSTIEIPDQVLAKQYANEMYKFGSAAREDSYPIPLQSVWTADNGKLPPWKGDYHHDLNTQLSYWPCYTGNHLTEGLGYINTLWNQREVNRSYTKRYFEQDGLNVPGVCTLDGVEMGGWIQYSMSPTVAAWLAQHFFLHYQYSKDKQFLNERGYPYVKDVVTFLENFSTVGSDGVRKLPLSSSPEVFDNSIHAWFKEMTNYDLALARNAFVMAAKMAEDLDLQDEANHWKKVGNEFQSFDVDETGGLTFAKGFPYDQSHRHFSNAMAIHPLGLIDWNNGEADQRIIQATLNNFDRVGPDYWTGYSYSWLGNMKARAMDGEGAAEALRTFAECFCLRNTFHANGDQSKSGKSLFTYRPFTLEGNFAFASGIQEMLIQSHTGIIRLFPAIPASWKDVSFDQLRTYGAFLVSAEMKDGKVVSVKVLASQDGKLQLLNPFNPQHNYTFSGDTKNMQEVGAVFEVEMKQGEEVIFS